MKNLNPPNYLISCLFLIVLIVATACKKEDDPPSSSLTAFAGTDQNILVGEQVNLNGLGSSDSNGNPFDFSWNFISKPSSSIALLDEPTTGNPSFTPDVAGKYKLELTISNASQSKDTVTISAFSVITVDGNYDNIIPGPNVGIRDMVVALDNIYITCEFTEIGTIVYYKIACYNVSGFSALDCGLEDGSIYDMIEFQGDLYVTGQFDEIGCIEAKNIARWDGADWHAVSGGLTGGDNPFGYSLAVYNGDLYVGGQFTMAGNVIVSNFAKWDGIEWSNVGNIEGGSVRSMQVYDQKLIVGGFFDLVNGNSNDFITSYNGSNWAALGSSASLELGSTGAVRHMAVYKNELYISGDFEINGSNTSELSVWNGSQFRDFGRPFSLFTGNIIYELKTINDLLYIGGNFVNVVGSQANNLLQWDGSEWGKLSQGTSGTVLSIDYYNDQIFIGGEFTSAGGITAENFSIWAEN